MIEHVERYPLLELAAYLRLAVSAAAEGWDLPDLPPFPAAGEGRIIAEVQPEDALGDGWHMSSRRDRRPCRAAPPPP